MKTSEVFDNIYTTGVWGVGSGPGSDPANAMPWIDEVNKMLAQSNIKTVLDIGCGDWQLGKHYNLEGKEYTGMDVSEKILETTKLNATDNIKFIQANAAEAELPKVDLILIKDVLQHLPNETVEIIMDKIVASCKYALICNDIGHNNSNTHVGGHRGLNLREFPFEYPLTHLRFYGSPIKLIDFYEAR